MLSKKFLSLSLAAGLAVSASSNVFALGGQSDVASSPSATQCSTEIMSNITTLLATRACVIALLNTINAIISPEVQAFCQQLKYSQDVNKLAVEFERLYNSNKEFKEVVDEAWITDATGSKTHASIQCTDQREVRDATLQSEHIKKYHTSTWE